jgi:hypothetical protein
MPDIEGNRLSDMDFDEVSLVTRGANQDAKVVLFKGDDDIEKQCMDDHRKLKKRERCSTCGMVSTGKMGKMRKASVIDKIADVIAGHIPEEDQETILDKLSKTLNEPSGNEDTMDEPDTHKEIQMPVTKDEKEKVTEPDLSGVSDEVKAYIDAIKKDGEELLEDNKRLAVVADEAINADNEDDDDDDDDDEDDVEKAIAKADPALAGLIRKMQADAAATEERAKAAEMIAKAEQDRREGAEMVSLAKSWTGNIGAKHDDLGSALLDIKKNCTEETFSQVETVLKAADEAVKTGELFKAAGTTGHDTVAGSAEEMIDQKVAELRKADPSLDEVDALSRVLSENRDLYAKYDSERRNGARS